MSSIFNDKFTNITQRIDALSGETTKPSSRPEIGPQQDFSNLLASLEQTTAKANEIGMSGDTGKLAGLSNLSNIEAERSKVKTDTKIVEKLETAKLFEVPITKTDEKSVNNVSGAVKDLSVDNTENSLKMMPYLHRTKYAVAQELHSPDPALPKVVPPQLPKLLSISQITQPRGVDGVDRYSAIQEMISKVSQSHGIDPSLSMALAKAESSFNPNAVSKDGYFSKGLFQLLDSTGVELAENANLGKENYDPFNPDLNADLGVRYLSRLMDTFSKETQIGSQKTFAVGDKQELEKLAVAAFNAGEGNVTAAQHRANKLGLDPTNFEDVSRFLPKITQNHVQRVVAYREELQRG